MDVIQTIMSKSDTRTVRRLELLAVLLNSIWCERRNGLLNKVIEMHLSEQVAHLTAGVCWVLSPDEYRRLEAESISKSYQSKATSILKLSRRTYNRGWPSLRRVQIGSFTLTSDQFLKVSNFMGEVISIT